MPASQDVIPRVREVLTSNNDQLYWRGVALALLKPIVVLQHPKTSDGLSPTLLTGRAWP
jgi:hypothetical protein